jgi:hypothetical protein
MSLLYGNKQQNKPNNTESGTFLYGVNGYVAPRNTNREVVTTQTIRDRQNAQEQPQAGPSVASMVGDALFGGLRPVASGLRRLVPGGDVDIRSMEEAQRDRKSVV